MSEIDLDIEEEVLGFLRRKRRVGRSLTDDELRVLFEVVRSEKESGMSSEALLSSSACPGASLAIEGETRVVGLKTGDEKNERA